MEDIGALSVLFSTNTSTNDTPLSPYPLTSPSQITERLKLFEKIRKERMGLVMGMSGCVFGREEEFVRRRPWLWSAGVRDRDGKNGKVDTEVKKEGLKDGEAHTRFLYG